MSIAIMMRLEALEREVTALRELVEAAVAQAPVDGSAPAEAEGGGIKAVQRRRERRE